MRASGITALRGSPSPRSNAGAVGADDVDGPSPATSAVREAARRRRQRRSGPPAGGAASGPTLCRRNEEAETEAEDEAEAEDEDGGPREGTAGPRGKDAPAFDAFDAQWMAGKA